MSSEHIVPITSRAEFVDAVRASFASAAREGAREILLVDADFVDWPLNEQSVIDSLAGWVDSRRSLLLFGHSFDEIARRYPRFVDWRRQWAHAVRCRSDPELEAAQLPTLVLVPGVTCVRLVDRVHHRGTASNRGVDMAECQEAVDALLQRSVEAFPVTTLGL